MKLCNFFSTNLHINIKLNVSKLINEHELLAHFKLSQGLHPSEAESTPGLEAPLQPQFGNQGTFLQLKRSERRKTRNFEFRVQVRDDQMGIF